VLKTVNTVGKQQG